MELICGLLLIHTLHPSQKGLETGFLAKMKA